MTNGLVLGAMMSAAIAVVYGYVGYRTALRPVDAEARLAARTFSTWWYGLSVVTAVGVLNNIAALIGIRDVAYFATMTYVNLLVICIALWGLLFYLVYVYTGKRGWIVPLSIGYAAYFATLVYYISASQPSGVLVGGWNVRLEYANPITGPVTIALVSLLVGPQILAAFGYFMLYFQVQDRTQRFRILIVSWSVMLWFGTTLMASFTGLTQYSSWNIISRLIALGAALAILTAFAPPQWMRKRFGLATSTHTSPGGAQHA